MSRYDWPSPPRRADNPGAPAEHRARARPAADTAVTPPPVPTQAVAVALDAPSGALNLWFPIGPSAMTRGQAGGGPNGPAPDPHRDIEPQHGQRLYAASASGGVWFSQNGGTDWAP